MNKNASITVIVVAVILVAGTIGAVVLNNQMANKRAAQANAIQQKKIDDRKINLESCLDVARFDYGKGVITEAEFKAAEDTCYSRFSER